MQNQLCMILLSKGSKVFYLLNNIINRIFQMGLSFLSPMALNTDDLNYKTKNICCRHETAEINGGDIDGLLGSEDPIRLR